MIEQAEYIGVREHVESIDVLQLAKDIAQHPDARANFAQVLALVEHPTNYYARWAAIRVIGLLGPASVRSAESVLRRRLALEDFDLAKRELNNALAKLDDFKA